MRMRVRVRLSAGKRCAGSGIEFGECSSGGDAEREVPGDHTFQADEDGHQCDGGEQLSNLTLHYSCNHMRIRVHEFINSYITR